MDILGGLSMATVRFIRSGVSSRTTTLALNPSLSPGFPSLEMPAHLLHQATWSSLAHRISTNAVPIYSTAFPILFTRTVSTSFAK